MPTFHARLHFSSIHICSHIAHSAKNLRTFARPTLQGPKLPIATAGRLTTQLNAITRIFTALEIFKIPGLCCIKSAFREQRTNKSLGKTHKYGSSVHCSRRLICCSRNSVHSCIKCTFFPGDMQISESSERRYGIK